MNILERLVTSISASNFSSLKECVEQKKYKLKPYVKTQDIPSALTVGRVVVHFLKGEGNRLPDVICEPDMGVGRDYVKMWRQTGIGNLMNDWKKNRLFDEEHNPLYHELSYTTNGEKHNAIVRVMNEDVKDVCLGRDDISIGVGRAIINIEDKRYLVIREKPSESSWISKYKTFDTDAPDEGESHITTYENTRADFSQLF